MSLYLLGQPHSPVYCIWWTNYCLPSCGTSIILHFNLERKNVMSTMLKNQPDFGSIIQTAPCSSAHPGASFEPSLVQLRSILVKFFYKMFLGSWPWLGALKCDEHYVQEPTRLRINCTDRPMFIGASRRFVWAKSRPATIDIGEVLL
jgi:hypothetical protein